MAETGAASVGPGSDGFPRRPEPPLPIAISQCLLGAEVRYDGSAAGFALPHAALTGLFEYRGICPEVAIGLGTPRAPIRLVGDPVAPRVLGVDDPALDVTDALRELAQKQAPTLDGVAGYVFMRGSPSCGLFDVKVYPHESLPSRSDLQIATRGLASGIPTRNGRGAYAAAVVAARPHLPVEENGRLHDPLLRESFLVRTFAYAHWQALERAGITSCRLTELHRRYRYLLMAHSPAHCEQAERLLSDLDDVARKAPAYIGLLMAGLSHTANRRGNAAVLARLRDEVAGDLDGAACREIDACIRGYRRGEVALREAAGIFEERLRRRDRIDAMHEIYFHPVPAVPNSPCSAGEVEA